jgi:protein SCO1/2
LAFVVVVLVAGIGFFLKRPPDTVRDPDSQSLAYDPDYARHLVNFSLSNQLGQPVSLKDLEGKIVVVDFIFTNCSVSCPIVNAQMAEIQKKTAGQSDVKLVSLTLDPTDDTVEVLKNYSLSLNPDPARWSFLTGDEAVIHNLVLNSFLPPDTTGQFAYMPGNFAHTQRIALVDTRGRVVKYYDGLNSGAAQAILAKINELRGHL